MEMVRTDIWWKMGRGWPRLRVEGDGWIFALSLIRHPAKVRGGHAHGGQGLRRDEFDDMSEL